MKDVDFTNRNVKLAILKCAITSLDKEYSLFMCTAIEDAYSQLIGYSTTIHARDIFPELLDYTPHDDWDNTNRFADNLDKYCEPYFTGHSEWDSVLLNGEVIDLLHEKSTPRGMVVLPCDNFIELKVEVLTRLKEFYNGK